MYISNGTRIVENGSIAGTIPDVCAEEDIFEYFNGRGRGRRRSTSRNHVREMHREVHYCYTYRSYVPTSREYETPGASYKETAVYMNMMAGSTQNCEQ